jgi:hypothetical protein
VAPTRSSATQGLTSLQRTIVLDADGLSKLARRDQRARQMIQRVVSLGGTLAIPPLAVIQAMVDGIGRPPIDQVLDAYPERPIDRGRIDLAAHLLRATRTSDVPDALVAAEALISAPSVVITSDPDDIHRLLEVDPRRERVVVWRV